MRGARHVGSFVWKPARMSSEGWNPADLVAVADA